MLLVTHTPNHLSDLMRRGCQKLAAVFLSRLLSAKRTADMLAKARAKGLKIIERGAQ